MNKMYFFILILSVIYSYFIRPQFDTTNVITFLSIIMGFQITAFALLFSSDTVHLLYKQKDKEFPQLTLKHRLKNYYKNSFNTLLISIIILLLCPSHWMLLNLVTLPIILVNSYMLYTTNEYLYKIFIKEKEHAKK